MSFLTSDIVDLLARGLAFTLLLTVVTTITSLLAGVAIGTMRLSGHKRLNRLATIYIDLFRNIPALLLIIFFAFAVPNLFSQEMRQGLFFDNVFAQWGKQITGLSLPYYLLAAIIALTLNSSAYLAELFRAGVGTIPKQYIDAARTLGATNSSVFWQIVLPRGLSAAFPAISTRLIHNMKNTALVAFVAVPDFFHATQATITRTFKATEFLLLAAGMYLLLSLLFSALLRQAGRRLDPQPQFSPYPRRSSSLEVGEI